MAGGVAHRADPMAWWWLLVVELLGSYARALRSTQVEEGTVLRMAAAAVVGSGVVGAAGCSIEDEFAVAADIDWSLLLSPLARHRSRARCTRRCKRAARGTRCSPSRPPLPLSIQLVATTDEVKQDVDHFLIAFVFFFIGRSEGEGSHRQGMKDSRSRVAPRPFVRFTKFL